MKCIEGLEMRVTKCCRLMLQWINGHGFVTIQQAATWIVTDDRGDKEFREVT